jgi:acyl carrier protein
MNDQRSRILQCFAAAFPDQPAKSLPTASMDTVKQWDSLAHVTLLSLISEEFTLDLAADDYEALTSFTAVEDYVRNHVS